MRDEKKILKINFSFSFFKFFSHLSLLNMKIFSLFLFLKIIFISSVFVLFNSNDERDYGEDDKTIASGKINKYK